MVLIRAQRILTFRHDSRYHTEHRMKGSESVPCNDSRRLRLSPVHQSFLNWTIGNPVVSSMKMRLAMLILPSYIFNGAEKLSRYGEGKK